MELRIDAYNPVFAPLLTKLYSERVTAVPARALPEAYRNIIQCAASSLSAEAGLADSFLSVLAEQGSFKRLLVPQVAKVDNRLAIQWGKGYVWLESTPFGLVTAVSKDLPDVSITFVKFNISGFGDDHCLKVEVVFEDVEAHSVYFPVRLVKGTDPDVAQMNLYAKRDIGQLISKYIAEPHSGGGDSPTYSLNHLPKGDYTAIEARRVTTNWGHNWIIEGLVVADHADERIRAPWAVWADRTIAAILDAGCAIGPTEPATMSIIDFRDTKKGPKAVVRFIPSAPIQSSEGMIDLSMI